jgi:hypothetical protein
MFGRDLVEREDAAAEADRPVAGDECELERVSPRASRRISVRLIGKWLEE